MPRIRSNLLSLLLHALTITVLFLAGRSASHVAPMSPSPKFIPLYYAPPLHASAGSTGRGGGGQNSPTPPSHGRLPRAAKIQFTPPVVRPPETQPKLVIEPTIVTNAELHIPTLPLPIGDPNGVPGPPSGGPGSGGGIGDSKGTGVGHTRGAGAGNDGEDGIATAHGGRVSPPVLLWKIDPDYSEEARKAKFQGAVMLRVEIGTDGLPQSIHVAEPLGLGLDEKAIAAVRQWRFRPGMRDGRPVPTSALVEVHFRLL
ncbi:MAG TPA: energy transducer TonB [Bryobacteraceae bacterium]|nr:energy transducer TonB [Bryobacteraceae bacterium]